jgi:hypothetical protein
MHKSNVYVAALYKYDIEIGMKHYPRDKYNPCQLIWQVVNMASPISHDILGFPLGINLSSSLLAE